MVLILRTMTSAMTLDHARALDAQDPLAPMRAQFAVPDGVIYLDGNSLGALPTATAARVAQAVQHEWGQGLIRSWNTAGWIASPQRVGDLMAPLIGAQAGQVVAADSTSINLYKVLHATLLIAGGAHSVRAGGLKSSEKRHNIVLSERSNFPTDLYIAQSLCAQHGFTLKLVEGGELEQALTDEVAVLMLTHVHYRSGRMHDMAALTARAHAVGALAIWDLAHSAGAVPVDLLAADADFAVGCGYKYLNGGPGAPAFVWVHPRHAQTFAQPLTGWIGHAQPFAFTPDYAPAPGITRALCGTPPILAMTALESGLQVFAQVAGGMQALRTKSLKLTDLFIELAEQRVTAHGFTLITPREHGLRGSQVSFAPIGAREKDGYAIMQALIARGVIGDFRAGDANAPADSTDRHDILRFGFAPLYNSFAEVWQAVEHWQAVMTSGEWQRAEFQRKAAVT
jgi:kynureninase